MNDNQKAAKSYLQQVKHRADRIEDMQRHVEHLRQRLELPALNYGERVSGSKRHDTFENKMIECFDKELRLAELVFKYELFRDDVLMQVLNLDAEEITYTQVLYLVYFKFLKQEDVAKIMGLSTHYITHLHPEALSLFYNQYLAGKENDEGDECEPIAS